MKSASNGRPNGYSGITVATTVKTMSTSGITKNTQYCPAGRPGTVILLPDPDATSTPTHEPLYTQTGPEGPPPEYVIVNGCSATGGLGLKLMGIEP